MTLRTRVCDLLGIEVPIVLAGMGGASTPELAAAVSNAGGLGVLGAASVGGDRLREWIARTRELTDRPFGVDTLLPASVRRGTPPKAGTAPEDLLDEYRDMARRFMEREGLDPAPAADRAPDLDLALFTKEFFEAQMEIVIEEKVPVYAAGLGNPAPWMDRLHANGTKVIAVVGAVRHAVKVAASGVDLVVAQGHDAGGHNSPIGTMALIPQVVDAVQGLPVLAAGGISDGRGVAAGLMLGAEGAWIGSLFLATDESGIEDFQKQAILDASEEGTTVSKSITGKPARVIRSKWSDAWAGSDLEPLPMPFQGMVSGPVMEAGRVAKRADIVPGFAGQGIGMIRRVRPAAEVLREVVAQAEEALREVSARSLG